MESQAAKQGKVDLMAGQGLDDIMGRVIVYPVQADAIFILQPRGVPVLENARIRPIFFPSMAA